MAIDSPHGGNVDTKIIKLSTEDQDVLQRVNKRKPLRELFACAVVLATIGMDYAIATNFSGSSVGTDAFVKLAPVYFIFNTTAAIPLAAMTSTQQRQIGKLRNSIMHSYKTKWANHFANAKDELLEHIANTPAEQLNDADYAALALLDKETLCQLPDHVSAAKLAKHTKQNLRSYIQKYTAQQTEKHCPDPSEKIETMSSSFVLSLFTCTLSLWALTKIDSELPLKAARFTAPAPEPFDLRDLAQRLKKSYVKQDKTSQSATTTPEQKLSPA